MVMKWGWNPISYFFSDREDVDVQVFTSVAQEDFVEFPTILDLPSEVPHKLING